MPPWGAIAAAQNPIVMRRHRGYERTAVAALTRNGMAAAKLVAARLCCGGCGGCAARCRHNLAWSGSRIPRIGMGNDVRIAGNPYRRVWTNAIVTRTRCRQVPEILESVLSASVSAGRHAARRRGRCRRAACRGRRRWNTPSFNDVTRICAIE